MRVLYSYWCIWCVRTCVRTCVCVCVCVCAGRRNAEFNWIDAREAADRIFAELPENADDISFADLANHLQEVLAVSYSAVCV